MKSAQNFLVHLAGILATCPANNQDSTQKLLEQLSNAIGPSGAEEPVRAMMAEHMKPLADELQYDCMGSVIAPQGSAGPRMMIDAHMDELGGMIRRIPPNGLLWMYSSCFSLLLRTAHGLRFTKPSLLLAHALDHDIVGVALERNLRKVTPHPFVERIVHVEIGQQRTNNSALRRAA
jgi:hypothetical protein